MEQNKKSYREHSERNKKIIKDSLERYGAGRSILLSSDDKIIAGNAVYEQAKEIGMPVKVIESDGKKLIVLVRKDLKNKSKEREELAIIDNSSSDSSRFNIARINNELPSGVLDRLGVPVLVVTPPVLKENKEKKKKEPKKVRCPFCGEFTEV